MAKIFEADSVALGAMLIGQTKGDIAQARRAAASAAAWLQSIDPSYKPEPTQAPAGDWLAVRDELQLKLSTVTGERDDARRSLRTAEGVALGRQREIDSLRADLSAEREQLRQAQNDVAALRLRLSAGPAMPAPAAAVVPPPPPPGKAPLPPAPVKAATPAPAPVAAPVAPSPSKADPYAGLPDNLRAWAAKRDAAKTAAPSLEID